jgi:hypothetical protein
LIGSENTGSQRGIKREDEKKVPKAQSLQGSANEKRVNGSRGAGRGGCCNMFVS